MPAWNPQCAKCQGWIFTRNPKMHSQLSRAGGTNCQCFMRGRALPPLFAYWTPWLRGRGFGKNDGLIPGRSARPAIPSAPRLSNLFGLPRRPQQGAFNSTILKQWLSGSAATAKNTLVTPAPFSLRSSGKTCDSKLQATVHFLTVAQHRTCCAASGRELQDDPRV